MPTLSIFPSYPIFQDKNGNPLERGYINIGTAGSDPVANAITVYYDSGLTQTATQPIRTVAGYPVNSSNERTMLYMSGSDYSLRVADSNNVQVTYELNATDVSYLTGSTAQDNTANIATNTANIATNTSNIATNTSNISTNTSSISTNAGNISTNTSNISTNTSNIATNTSNIAANTAAIAAISPLWKDTWNAYIDDNQTGASSTTWQSVNLGTRLDVTDDWTNTIFKFDIKGRVYSSAQTNRYIEFDGFLTKKVGSEPQILIKSSTGTVSGATTGEAEVIQGALTASGTKINIGTTANGNFSTGFGTVNIERQDNSDEFCVRIDVTYYTAVTNMDMQLAISGTRDYSGSLLSSSNGTEF